MYCGEPMLCCGEPTLYCGEEMGAASVINSSLSSDIIVGKVRVVLYYTKNSRRIIMDTPYPKLISQAVILAAGIGFPAYYAATHLKSKEEYAATEHLADRGGAETGIDKWLAELKPFTLKALHEDSSMINALDALAVFRHGSPHKFKSIIVEVENFYLFYFSVAPYTAADPVVALRARTIASKFMSNIEQLLSSFKKDIVSTYPSVLDKKGVSPLHSRLTFRIGNIFSNCTKLYENLVKDCSIYSPNSPIFTTKPQPAPV